MKLFLSRRSHLRTLVLPGTRRVLVNTVRRVLCSLSTKNPRHTTRGLDPYRTSVASSFTKSRLSSFDRSSLSWRTLVSCETIVRADDSTNTVGKANNSRNMLGSVRTSRAVVAVGLRPQEKSCAHGTLTFTSQPVCRSEKLGRRVTSPGCSPRRSSRPRQPRF